MVKHYPHTMTWTLPGQPPSKDEDGNPIPGLPGEERTAPCRYENFRIGNRREFTGRDGKTVYATGVVYEQFGHEIPMRFTEITVTRDVDGVVVFKGEVINPYSGQMNTTLYVVENAVRT